MKALVFKNTGTRCSCEVLPQDKGDTLPERDEEGKGQSQVKEKKRTTIKE